MLLRETTLESKVVPTKLKDNISITHWLDLFQHWVLFFLFKNIFLTNSRHQNKNNVVERISHFVYEPSKNIAYITSLNTLNIVLK